MITNVSIISVYSPRAIMYYLFSYLPPRCRPSLVPPSPSRSLSGQYIRVAVTLRLALAAVHDVACLRFFRLIWIIVLFCRSRSL